MNEIKMNEIKIDRKVIEYMITKYSTMKDKSDFATGYDLIEWANFNTSNVWLYNMILKDLNKLLNFKTTKWQQ